MAHQLHDFQELIGSVKEYLLQEFPEGGFITVPLSHLSDYQLKPNLLPYNGPSSRLFSLQKFTQGDENKGVILENIAPLFLRAYEGKELESDPLEGSKLGLKKEPELIKTQPAQQFNKISPITISPPIAVASSKPQEPLPKASIVEQQSTINLQELPPQEQPPKLRREPMQAAKEPDFSAIKRLWVEKIPQYSLIETPLQFENAKPSNVPPVVLLAISNSPAEYDFLTQVASAIERYFIPAKVIESSQFPTEKDWQAFLQTPSLKMIVAPQNALFGIKEAMKFYQENLERGYHKLGNIHLTLISNVSLYMQEPKLKRTLWQTLCQTLNASRYVS